MPRLARSSPLIARRDAWPPTGGVPGSDLDFMRKQHLDPFDVEFGILQVLDLFIFSQQNLEFGAAIQRAINDWQLAFWAHRDPRLKASIYFNSLNSMISPYANSSYGSPELAPTMAKLLSLDVFTAND